MPNVDLTAIRRRGSEAFSGFTSGQRAMLGLALLGTFVGGMLFLRWSGSPEMAPLYSNLEAADAAQITDALDSQGVDYQLRNGGATILVPRSRVHDVRLDLSADGLPSAGSPGYELLDDQGITTSEFRQRVDYQRALEGELSSTIESIDGVDDAIVHLVIPEEDLFSGDAQHPSASVLVSTTQANALGAGQVQAVVNLVASSVEGLEASEVTVADATGRVLSAPGEGGLAAAAGDARASQTAGFEAALGARIQEMLLPVTGADRARVTVTAQLDFDQRETTSETFGEPNTAPVISETTNTETFEGDSTAVGGVLGPDALPTTGETGEGSTYERSSTERVFANERITEVVQDAPGDVQRLSVAVLLDEAAGIDTRAVQQLVAAGAGIDVARGDTLEVSQLPFDTTSAEAAAAELAEARSAEERTQLFSLLRTVASVAIVAIVLFLAWRSHRKASVARYPVALPLDVADPDERGLPSAPARDGFVDEAESVALPAAPSEADIQREELQGQITELIERQPDDVAQVLRSWMTERV